MNEANGFYRIVVAYDSGGSSTVYLTGEADAQTGLLRALSEGNTIIYLRDIDGCAWIIMRDRVSSFVVSHYPGRVPENAHHAHVMAVNRDERRVTVACTKEGIDFGHDHDEGALPGEKPIDPKDRPN